jgi:hypothetical protein
MDQDRHRADTKQEQRFIAHFDIVSGIDIGNIYSAQASRLVVLAHVFRFAFFCILILGCVSSYQESEMDAAFAEEDEEPSTDDSLQLILQRLER